MTTAPLIQQARAAAGRGDYDTARRLCAQVLGRDRKERTALLMLAEIENNVGRFDLAIAHVKRAIGHEPRNPGLYIRLGQMYTNYGRFPKAHAALDKAIKLQPGAPSAVASKANVYERQDKYDRAREVLRPFVREGIKPDPETGAVYLRVLVHDGDIDAGRAYAERLLAAGLPDGPALRNALFAAVKIFERAGDFDAAFAVAARANAIEPAAYDPEWFRRRVDRMITVFSRAAIESMPRPKTVSERPLFIVGMPRCGSTLTERILDAHPDAHGADEIPTLHNLIQRLPEDLGSARKYPECAAEMTAEDVERNACAYLDALGQFAPKARFISNKDLSNFRNLGLIAVLFPRARVIHCRRDAVDTCLSCYTERLRPGACPYSTDLGHLGLYYREYERLMDHWRSTIDTPLLEVHYEELIADQEPTTRRILEFCDLPWHEGCLRFHEVKRNDLTLSYDQVRRPLYATSVGRAAAYGGHLDPLREALGGG